MGCVQGFVLPVFLIVGFGLGVASVLFVILCRLT